MARKKIGSILVNSEDVVKLVAIVDRTAISIPEEFERAQEPTMMGWIEDGVFDSADEKWPTMKPHAML